MNLRPFLGSLSQRQHDLIILADDLSMVHYAAINLTLLSCNENEDILQDSTFILASVDLKSTSSSPVRKELDKLAACWKTEVQGE